MSSKIAGLSLVIGAALGASYASTIGTALKDTKNIGAAITNLNKTKINLSTYKSLSRAGETGTVKFTRLGESLRKSGIDTDNLNRSVKKLNISLLNLKKQEKISIRADGLREVYDKQKSSIVETAAIGYALYKPVNIYGQVASAQGQIKSLGISDAGIQKITKAAKEYSNTWSGTTQAQFISASYDIKSGIASLGDAAVGEFTKIAALTGKATKSNTTQMTSLFATGYGIYRKQFGTFGASTIKGWQNLTEEQKDIKFGEYFAAGIAGTVRAFKTDGAQMQAAISALGASATTQGIKFSEQLTVLGMLQKTMSGSEAATKYKSFLQAAYGAGEKLGLTFTNSNDQLLSMPEILEQVRDKYGDTLSAVEKDKLKDALGTDEALALMDLFYDSTGKLREGMNVMEKELKRGLTPVEEMAKAMDGPNEKLQLAGQRFGNLMSSIGKALAPTVELVGSVFGQMAIGLDYLVEQYPVLTSVIAGTTAALLGGLVAYRAVSIASSFLGLQKLKLIGAAFGLMARFPGVAMGATLAGKAFTWSSIRTKAATAAAWLYSVASKALVVSSMPVSNVVKSVGRALSWTSIKTKALTAATWLQITANRAMALGSVAASNAIRGIGNALSLSSIKTGAATAATWLFNTASKALAIGSTVVSAAIRGIGLALAATPIGLVITGIALGAGLIINYWEPISGFFSRLWDGVTSFFSDNFGSILDILSFSPIGIIIQSWEPITDFLGSVWDTATAAAEDFFGWIGKKLEGIGSVIGKVAGWLGFGDEENKNTAPVLQKIVKPVQAAVVGTTLATSPLAANTAITQPMPTSIVKTTTQDPLFAPHSSTLAKKPELQNVSVQPTPVFSNAQQLTCSDLLRKEAQNAIPSASTFVQQPVSFIQPKKQNSAAHPIPIIPSTQLSRSYKTINNEAHIVTPHSPALAKKPELQNASVQPTPVFSNAQQLTPSDTLRKEAHNAIPSASTFVRQPVSFVQPEKKPEKQNSAVHSIPLITSTQLTSFSETTYNKAHTVIPHSPTFIQQSSSPMQSNVTVQPNSVIPLPLSIPKFPAQNWEMPFAENTRTQREVNSAIKSAERFEKETFSISTMQQAPITVTIGDIVIQSSNNSKADATEIAEEVKKAIELALAEQQRSWKRRNFSDGEF